MAEHVLVAELPSCRIRHGYDHCGQRQHCRRQNGGKQRHRPRHRDGPVAPHRDKPRNSTTSALNSQAWISYPAPSRPSTAPPSNWPYPTRMRSLWTMPTSLAPTWRRAMALTTSSTRSCCPRPRPTPRQPLRLQPRRLRSTHRRLCGRPHRSCTCGACNVPAYHGRRQSRGGNHGCSGAP